MRTGQRSQQVWWRFREAGLEQGWAELHHSASGPECCACFVEECHLGSAAVGGFCVLLTLMRSALQHHMRQPLAGSEVSLHESGLQTAGGCSGAKRWQFVQALRQYGWL